MRRVLQFFKLLFLIVRFAGLRGQGGGVVNHSLIMFTPSLICYGRREPNEASSCATLATFYRLLNQNGTTAAYREPLVQAHYIEIMVIFSLYGLAISLTLYFSRKKRLTK